MLTLLVLMEMKRSQCTKSQSNIVSLKVVDNIRNSTRVSKGSMQKLNTKVNLNKTKYRMDRQESQLSK